MPSFNPDTEMPLEEGVAKYEIQQSVINTLASKGITQPQKPITIDNIGQSQWFMGEIPTDLTQMSDDALGTLLGKLSEWQNYIYYQLAEARMNWDKAQEQFEFVEAKLMMVYKYDDGQPKKKRTEPERKACKITDRRYVEQRFAVNYYESLYRFIDAIAKGADNNWAAVSRRITQRGQNIERDRRNSSVTHAPSNMIFRSQLGK